MIVFDFFSGLEGWSKPFKERGHIVVTVDIESKFNPTICANLFSLKAEDFRKYGQPDLIVASPPCTEFTKSTLPKTWASVKKYGCNPDTSLLKKVLQLIRELNPRWWVIENVRGAIKYFKPLMGRPVKKIGSRYLWGKFPIFDSKPTFGKWKISPSKCRASLRSLIPKSIALALCLSCESFIQTVEV